MTRTDGEHELVLGNKQLLSAFFLVVILMGVFFTMGYFVGRNTAMSGFNPGSSGSPGGQRPDAAVDPSSGAGATPASDAGSPAEAPRLEARQAVSRANRTSGEDTAREPMAQPTSEQKYLQVSAVRRPDADNMVKVLREHGFPAL